MGKFWLETGTFIILEVYSFILVPIYIYQDPTPSQELIWLCFVNIIWEAIFYFIFFLTLNWVRKLYLDANLPRECE